LRTFAVINQKGGCGKTTTAINLAASLAATGRRVLLVDLDPQGHCALGLAVPESRVQCQIGDLMLADDPSTIDPSRLVWQISARLDLAPSTVALTAVERQIVNAPDRDLRLTRALTGLAPSYDLCIIDCPPAIGMLTFNALRAAREVIIPVETGYFALRGARKQITTLRVLTEQCGHRLRVYVLPNMYDVRLRLGREIMGELARQFGDAVLPTPIHYNAKLKEAVTFGQPITEYAPASRGTKDFAELAGHLLNHAPEEAAEQPTLMMRENLRAIDAASGALAAELGRAAPSGDAARSSDDALPGAAGGPSVDEAIGEISEPTEGSEDRRFAARAEAEARRRPPNGEIEVERRAATAAAGGGGPAPPPPSPASARRPLDRAAELVQRARALALRTRGGAASAPPPAEPTDPTRRSPQAQRQLAEKLAKLYGVKVTRQGALFVQPANGASQVAIAADFNSWQPERTPLKRDERLGVWQACVPLPPGRYRYRLVLDDQWVTDPHNTEVETNPFGEMNNIITVGEPGGESD